MFCHWRHRITMTTVIVPLVAVLTNSKTLRISMCPGHTMMKKRIKERKKNLSGDPSALPTWKQRSCGKKWRRIWLSYTHVDDWWCWHDTVAKICWRNKWAALSPCRLWSEEETVSRFPRCHRWGGVGWGGHFEICESKSYKTSQRLIKLENASAAKDFRWKRTNNQWMTHNSHQEHVFCACTHSETHTLRFCCLPFSPIKIWQPHHCARQADQ